MKYTGNYNLKKPEGSDIVNIEDLNDNADIIDQALKAHDDALATKETPEGAQQKADAALNSAKQYTDQEVGEVAQELAAHKADIENRIDNPEYSSEQVVTGGIGNLPENLVEGQINDLIVKGFTAQNIVKNGNFANEASNWFSAGSATLTVSNNVLSITGSGSFPYITAAQSGILNPNGDKLYICAYMRARQDNTPSLIMQKNASIAVITNPVKDVWYKLSGITADPTTNIIEFYAQYPSPSEAIDKIIELKNVMVINLTQVFGVGKEPDKAACDKIFTDWFDGTKSVPASLRIKTIGKNLYDPSKARLGTANSSGQIISSDSNVISDYIKIKPNTSYKFSVQNSNYLVNGFILYDNQKRYIRNGTITGDITDSNAGYVICRFRKSDFSVMTLDDVEKAKPMLEEGPTVTEYEEYKESIQYISAKDSLGNFIELHSLPNGTKDEIISNKIIKKIGKKILTTDDVQSIYTSHTNLDWVAIKKPSDYIGYNNYKVWSPENLIFFNFTKGGWSDSNENIGKYSTNYSATAIMFGVPKGTYANIEAARAAFVGKELIYQLATPQEIPLQVDGALQAFRDGTIYIEPYLKEEFNLTGTTIEFIPLPKPVSSIDKIEILQNGVWLEITGTLSSDGKTISVLSTGKYRVFAPIKSEESLIPEVSYTVPVNLKAQVDSNTKAITTMSKSIIDLNDKVDILSVEFNELNSAITFGGKFQIAYNSTTNSLDITVVS